MDHRLRSPPLPQKPYPDRRDADSYSSHRYPRNTEPSNGYRRDHSDKRELRYDRRNEDGGDDRTRYGGRAMRRRNNSPDDPRQNHSEWERERESQRDRGHVSERERNHERGRDDGRDRAGPSRRSASPRARSSRPRSTRRSSAAASRSPPPMDKAKPNFAPSGLLAADTNTVLGADGKKTVLKYNEPPEARKPVLGWRLYVFKGAEQVGEMMYVLLYISEISCAGYMHQNCFTYTDRVPIL